MPALSKSDDRALMIYDGLCGFCHGTVRWMIRRDRRDRFRFAPQQSALAGQVLARHGVDRERMLADNSVYLVLNYGSPDERVLRRSDVPVHVLLLLGGIWSFPGRILSTFPRALRDFAYTLVAKNRFRFAGRYESCPLPTPAERAKFVA